MTLRTACLIPAVALGQALGSAQTKPTQLAEPQIQAGLFTTRPDGQRGSSAVQTGNHVGADIGGIVYMAPCSSVGAAPPGSAVSASATEVWELSGKVLALSADEASVEIGRQRIRRGGQNETSAPQLLVTLRLKRGERVTLDRIDVPATGSCQARAGSLDVVFASTEGLLGRPDLTVVNGTSSGAGGDKKGSTGSQGEILTVRRVAPAAPTTLQADLWLVRSAPGRVDETLHITSPVVSIPRQFAFSPITVQTSNGVLNVRVEGTIEVGTSPEGERRLYFSANRTNTFAPKNRPPRDGAVVEGSTKTTVAMPKPDEVLSFEMPPLRIPGGEALPDRLSIRVRLTSVPMRK